jgi:hypothetical protein
VSRFLRARDGAFTTFDPPGSIFTIPTAINSNNGAVTGYYFDASFAIHGFLRSPYGAFVTIDDPAAINGTYLVGINPAGVSVGTYYDANYNLFSFVRTAEGASNLLFRLSDVLSGDEQ